MLDKSKIYTFSLKNQIHIIGFILLALFFLIRNPASKWDKTISGDGKSYYAYLTAAIIYHDLDYQFVEAYEAKYYPPDQSLFKEFRQAFNGEVANKTFPGITILWLPFFFLAHFLSYLLGFEPDGYSLLYQYAIGIAAIFYLWLGLKWLAKLLTSLGYKKELITPVLLLLVFGTNLFYYTIHDPSLTHVYNFTLLTGVLYFLRRFYISSHSKWLLISTLLFSIAIISRPTSLLIIVFFPLVIGNWQDIRNFFFQIFKKRQNIIGIILVSIIIGVYPIIWWYIQTGHLIVYSYGKEGFDFTNPHLLQILFSYEKGWLIYSPAILLSGLGFIYLFTKNRFQFFSVVFGFTFLAFVFSSWWIWTYGASFGQRVFVDYYTIIGLLLVAGLTYIQSSKIALGFWMVLAISFISLNQLQTYQFKNGILPTIGATKTSYWNSYFKLKAVRPSYPMDKSFQTIQQFSTDFETKVDWITSNSVTNDRAYSGKFSQYIDLNNPYSGALKTDIPVETDFILIRVQIYCESNSASPQLVFEIQEDTETSTRGSVGLMPYLSKNEWTTYYKTIDLQDYLEKSWETVYKTVGAEPHKEVGFTSYFWNPTDDKIWIDDLEITFGRYQ